MGRIVALFLTFVGQTRADSCSGFTPDAATYACYFKGCAVEAASGDCTKCCEGCHLETGDKGTYCMEDKGPSPSPSPSPSGDSWDNYQIAGMDVTSVTGGQDKTNYGKVVIMLHGGGGSGSDWQYQYNSGWFGDLTGFKYVFPTSPLSGRVWLILTKMGVVW